MLSEAKHLKLKQPMVLTMGLEFENIFLTRIKIKVAHGFNRGKRI